MGQNKWCSCYTRMALIRDLVFHTIFCFLDYIIIEQNYHLINRYMIKVKVKIK